MDKASEARLGEVMPLLADKVRQLADALAQEGIILKVAQGIRSWAQQNVLYAQGRTAPGKVVTNAAGGHSWHNFGAAVDCLPEVTDGVADWNPAHPQWKRMEALGVSLGLTTGAYWKRLVDAPHFQLTGRFPEGAPDDECRQLFLDGGMSAVWDAILASLA